MHFRKSFAILGLMGLFLPPGAASADDGSLNPDELTISYFLKKLERGEPLPMGSIHGYAAAKSGDYATARKIFGHYAAQGNTQAMTWLSWLDDNGFGGPENPISAAEWDRKAMEAGDHIGAFNYGLDLLRGRGVPKDAAKGRMMIIKAAEGGDATAQELIDHDFDLEAVTPDADSWKYNPYLF
ncbi:MAG: tetratricopeptide repeat protein [Magnetovibrionaceae bacterium]